MIDVNCIKDECPRTETTEFYDSDGKYVKLNTCPFLWMGECYVKKLAHQVIGDDKQ